jgi:hypothetical protein
MSKLIFAILFFLVHNYAHSQKLTYSNLVTNFFTTNDVNFTIDEFKVTIEDYSTGRLKNDLFKTELDFEIYGYNLSFFFLPGVPNNWYEINKLDIELKDKLYEASIIFQFSAPNDSVIKNTTAIHKVFFNFDYSSNCISNFTYNFKETLQKKFILNQEKYI